MGALGGKRGEPLCHCCSVPPSPSPSQTLSPDPLLEPLASIARLDPLRPISSDGKLWYAAASRPVCAPIHLIHQAAHLS